MNREKLGEKSIETLFLLCALVGVVSVTAIIVFVFYKGLHPFFGPDAYSFLDFITGTRWAPGENIYGIFYMIVASVLATVGAIVIGVPVGLLTAVFISELAPDRFVRIIKPAVELLAGIPSVLYGAFGLGIIVPPDQKSIAHGTGPVAAGGDHRAYHYDPAHHRVSVGDIPAGGAEILSGSILWAGGFRDPDDF